MLFLYYWMLALCLMFAIEYVEKKRGKNAGLWGTLKGQAAMYGSNFVVWFGLGMLYAIVALFSPVLLILRARKWVKK